MTMSATECTEVLRNLKQERARHEQVVAGIEKRRSEVSFEAAQGDADARAALAKIDAEEQASQSELRITVLAISRAQTLLETAIKTELEDSQKEREADLASLSAEVVAIDLEVVEIVNILRERLTQRADIIADVMALRILSDYNQRLLDSADSLGDALHDGLRAFLNVRGGGNTSGALRQFAARDANILGVEIEQPEKTVVQRALERSTEPSRFVSNVRPLSKPAVASGR